MPIGNFTITFVYFYFLYWQSFHSEANLLNDKYVYYLIDLLFDDFCDVRKPFLGIIFIFDTSKTNKIKLFSALIMHRFLFGL